MWRVEKVAAPKLLSTKDVAVQSNFYGTEEEGLEGALADVEGRWAALLRGVDAGEALEPLADELWHMVYLMAYRTSPLRSAFHSMGQRLVGHMHDNADSPHIKDGLMAYLDENFDVELAKVLERLPPPARQWARDNRQLLKEHAQRELQGADVGAIMRDLFGPLKQRETLQSVAKRGHNKGVSKLIEQGHGPAAVKPVAWRIIRDSANSVILGDCPVIATGGATPAPGAPWKIGKDCRAYYMPISPRQVLVGLRFPDDTVLTINDINTASAELSERCVFASSDDERTRQWSAAVGKRWMPLEDGEIDAMMNDLVRNFGRYPL